MNSGTWQLGHRPALDGLRGVAILLVLANHFAVPLASSAGQAGVTAFFVLSGFLITALLLEEQDRHGRVSMRGFYMRRVRRLMPALVVCVAVTTALLLPAGLMSAWQSVAALGYYMNFVEASRGFVGGPFGHTWSLAIEEQFYLLWPPLLVFLPRRWAVVVATVGVLATPFWRMWLVADGAGYWRLSYGLDTRADGLLAGCLLAMWMVGRRETRGFHGLAALAVATLVVVGMEWGMVWGPTLASVCALLVIYAATRGNSVRWLETRVLVWVGRRSYGLYLWHLPVVVVGLRSLPPLPWPAHAAVLLAVSLTLTALSWRFVEQPFLARRREASGRPDAHVGGAKRPAVGKHGA